MYLIRLNLDPNHPSVRQSLTDRQDMHRNLMKAFQTPRRESTVLYRLIESRTSLQVILLSGDEPDQERWIRNGITLMEKKNVDSLMELYREGAILHFTLLAHPSKKVKVENAKHSKRAFLTSSEDQTKWLMHQGEKYGFELLENFVDSNKKNILVGKKSGSFKLSVVDYNGALRITDADLFWKSWKEGIGPEKSYGLGLMLLRR